MKRLYRVEVTGELFVLAEDDREAERLAASHVNDDRDVFLVHGKPVTEFDILSTDERESLPWGAERGEPERTVGELYDEIKAAAEVEKRQVKLFGERTNS